MFFVNKKEPRNYNRRYPEEYAFCGSAFYYWFLYFVVCPVGYIFYKVKVTGRENLDSKKRYLFAANHNSYIDPPMVSLAVNRKVSYMAKEELFTHKNWLLRHLVIWLSAFAVNRSKPELATFKTIKDIVEKTNWSIGIFPQGTTTMGNDLTNMQKGFVVVAKKAKMDIVPVAIVGFDGYAKYPFQKNLTLKIGTPISYELSDDEIMYKWVDFMCKEAGYHHDEFDKIAVNQ